MSRIAIVLALAGLMVLPAVAGAASASVSVIGTQTSLHQSGAKVMFTETLRIGRRVVGRDKIDCTAASGNFYNCSGTYTLSNGTITVAGRVDQSRPNNTIRITGGRGSYAGGSGSLKLHDIGKTNRTQETFTFTS